MKRYKMRAECTTDVITFLWASIERIPFFEINKIKEVSPDVEVVFATDMPLNVIISKLRQVQDSHVMYQTVQPEENYTGVRNYNLKHQ